MVQSTEQSLLQAIKNDDLKAFDALATARTYSLGRFPVLSLLYLYKSRKILNAYEREFLSVSKYERKREPTETSVKFSGVAGKTLRLFAEEIVSPLEMLLILDRTKHLKRVFREAAKTEEIKARLRSIYAIKYALNVRFEGEDIVIDKRPLSYREKKKIITASLCAAFGVALAVCVPTVTVALIPTPVEGEVNNIGDIDFSSQKEYVLKRDIVLRESVGEVNCKINGAGGKLIFDSGAAFVTLNGSLSNVTVESSGDAIIGTVSQTARISNVTVNVKADVTTAEDSAFVATTNYGELDGVTVNVKGSVAATEPTDENATELTVSGMVLNNSYRFNVQTQETEYGVIKNCTVNYPQLELAGVAGANAVFGGIAGVNNAYLQGCTVTGKIAADTFDVAGVCSVNNGVISDCVNRADISQASADSDWNPIVCGIVMTNAYNVENCQNTGHISAVSTCEISGGGNEHTAAAAGIVYLNRNDYAAPYIISCVNTGAVESSAAYGNAYAAGVCTSSSGGIRGCKNSGAVKAESDNGYGAYVGGIAAYTYGYIYKSVNVGGVSAMGSGEAYAGGISAYTRAQLSYCTSSGDITVSAKNACAGGIFGLSDIDGYGNGTAEYCISENRLGVTTVAGGTAYVGGIAGYVFERELSASGGKAYFGGGVTDSCFIGSNVKTVDYFGNIVGVCGANIYASNLYYYNNEERHNLNGNYYTNSAFAAIGATISPEGGFATQIADKGATAATVEAIKNTVTYRSILEEIE